MISIDSAQQILSDLVDEVPKAFFRDLNGGIMLQSETKMSYDNKADDMYILGEYHRHHALGRLIMLYYGSFCAVYGDISEKKLKKKLSETLRHEFRHHVESLAGDRSLEIEDAQALAKYLGKKK